MILRYTDYLIRWRWLVIVMTLLLVGAAASGGRYLGFTTDYRAFFSTDNPQLQAFEALQNTYDRADNVVFIITPKTGDILQPDTLKSIKWLTENAWQTPYSIRVDSITNFQHSRASGDDLIVSDLVPEIATLQEKNRSVIRAVMRSEPLLLNRLVNEAATVTGVNVTVHLPGKSRTEVPEVAAFARALAKKMEDNNPNLTVGLSGMVMFNNAFGEHAKGDMTSLIPLMFAVVIGLAAILFRSVGATIATALLLMMSIMVGLGLFGWSGYKLTPPSASAPIIIMTIAVADAVHFLMSFLGEMRRGHDKIFAIKESLRINFQPIFLTSVTTVIGFLALNASEVPPIVHLGNIVAAGVVAAFLLSVTFLPALIAVLPIRTKAGNQRKRPLFAAVSNLVQTKTNFVLYGSAAISLLMLSFIPRNESNDDYVKYFSEATQFRQDTEYAIKHLIGPNNIQYSMEAGGPGDVNDPVFLESVQAFVDYLDNQPEVAHVFTITDTIKRLNKNMHGDDQAFYTLPGDRELAAQYLLLYELSLPLGLDLNNQVNLDKSATRVTVTFKAMSTAQMLKVEARFAEWLARKFPNLSFNASSSNLMFSHIGQRNTRSMIWGAVAALGLISFTLIIALKSIKIGLVSLVPNLIPIGIAFGIWGLMVGEVGLSLAPVVGMTLGIVVDDTIHFLSKYLRGRKEKALSAGGAVDYALKQVGPALSVTSAVLVAGFLVLTLSSFKLNSDMGLLAAITVAVALLVDLLLLPALLLKLDGAKNYDQTTVTAAIYSESPRKTG